MALAIEPLDGRRHDRNGFRCGVQALDHYLRALATQHRRKGIAQTFVLVDDSAPTNVLGYYSLSAASIHLSDLDGHDRKNLPRYPIPAIRVGRLAVAQDGQSRGYGSLLLQNAVKRGLWTREEVGVYALLVDAKDDATAQFYTHFGFRPCVEKSAQLYLPLGRT